MSNLNFLTEEQVVGNNQLDMFKIYGLKCTITDFSILLGGYSSLDYNDELSVLSKKFTGWWWLANSKDTGVSVIDSKGEKKWIDPYNREGGARPVLRYSAIRDDLLNRDEDEFGVVVGEYGDYPQDIVAMELSEVLEQEYLKGNLVKTGKTYTTDSVNYLEIYTSFQPREHIEYEYDGNKYIRFVGDSNCADAVLSDGRVIQEGDIYWVEVKSLKWLIDDLNDLAISEKLVFSGVQFDRCQEYYGDFSNVDISNFMNKYFWEDIRKRNIEKKELVGMLNEEDSNPYGFCFDEVSEEDIIKGAIESDVPVFLHGLSSDGKSARVKQFDPECIIIYLRNATPESLNGKSVYNLETGEMIDIKPTWLKKLEYKCDNEPEKYHIVFFDEITNALPSIQGIAFNVILDREVNGIWKLPDNARIVAAGNDMKDSIVANKMAEPLFNRFAHVYIETTVDNWLKWASLNNIHPAVYTYITYKNGDILRTSYDGEKPNADPRKWEMASKMLYKTGKPEMLRSLIGEDITREFCQFCNQKVLTLEDVLNGNYTDSDLKMNTSLLYATVMGLSRVDEDNFMVVRKFVFELGMEFCAIFDLLWSRGDEARLEMVAEARLVMSKGGRKVN